MIVRVLDQANPYKYLYLISVTGRKPMITRDLDNFSDDSRYYQSYLGRLSLSGGACVPAAQNVMQVALQLNCGWLALFIVSVGAQT